MVGEIQEHADRIFGAAFDADGALADRRQHLVGLEQHAAGRLQTQTV